MILFCQRVRKACDVRPPPQGAMRYNRGSVGATWFRRGLQSSAGHTEGGSPRKYNLKKLNCKR